AGTSTTSPAEWDPDAKRKAELRAIIKDFIANPTNNQKLDAANKARNELDELEALAKRRHDMREFILGKQPGPKDCAAPAGCSDTCTGLGRQLAAANACAGDLLNAVATALGRPGRGELPPRRPRGPVENPNPDAPTPANNSDICLLDQGAP